MIVIQNQIISYKCTKYSKRHKEHIDLIDSSKQC